MLSGERMGDNNIESPLIFFGMKDLGFSGYKYTWSNKRGDNNIEERLDNALASEEWMDMFPTSHHVGCIILFGIILIIRLFSYMLAMMWGGRIKEFLGSRNFLSSRRNGSMCRF